MDIMTCGGSGCLSFRTSCCILLSGEVPDCKTVLLVVIGVSSECVPSRIPTIRDLSRSSCRLKVALERPVISEISTTRLR